MGTTQRVGAPLPFYRQQVGRQRRLRTDAATMTFQETQRELLASRSRHRASVMPGRADMPSDAASQTVDIHWEPSLLRRPLLREVGNRKRDYRSRRRASSTMASQPSSPCTFRIVLAVHPSASATAS